MSGDDLTELQDALGYRFKDETILRRALVHASSRGEDNERLEFLGDAALGYAVSVALYQGQEQLAVGVLAESKANLVNNHRLAQIAIDLGIDRRMLIGASIEGERQKSPKICADALEAVIGALAMDGGIEAVQQFVDEHVYPLGDQSTVIERHAKTQLQEWAVSKGFKPPHYDVVTHESDKNGELWHVRCRVVGVKHVGKGAAPSKREAERRAAHDLLSHVASTT